ncbi:hypothetical protein SAMD00019534_103400 [Acytostelium subglobosum LB1]|uniref:hypothetical protein n=1 Tax=Acytostelium subglobosum LB1 TaxID=1410327 RepID=UPI0006449422|nr:hypothetical protein SAMD00019534_103400 [Acytostelium subglobosum LB1]GAM27165.1 hypothetical protein SAMD00019534_103400 [Acytostelium subglobosum LB1]|eukprot:XP_012750045.1 hypothetical protein SAMD00019534_103400 [Acytostelium subglobosum LB1]
MDTRRCGGWSDPADLCPGGDNIQCCVASRPTPAPTTAPPNYGSCTSTNGQRGTCKDVSQCGGWSDPADLCPGGDNIQCCVAGPAPTTAPPNYGSCTSTNGQRGTCKDVSQCSGWSDPADLCPGGDNIQCCVAGPAPTTAPPNYGSCTSTNGQRGTCKDVSQCTGWSDPADLCPGGNNIQCCVAPSPSISPNYGSCTSTNGQRGTCKDVSQCSGWSDPADLCPGGNNIQCCVAPSPSITPNYGSCTSTNGQRGTCKDVSQCSGWSDPADLCPGGNNIQCCVAPSPSISPNYGSCTSTNGQRGTCKDVSQCTGWSDPADLCPGGNNIQCCVSSLPSSSTTGSSSWGNCTSTNGNSGVCKDVSQCSGWSDPADLCPGGNNIQCCVTTGSQWGNCVTTTKEYGVCMDTAQCHGVSDPADLCPGPANIQCCISRSSTTGGTTGGVPGQCFSNILGKYGRCGERSQCLGFSDSANLCPGPDSIQCCVDTGFQLTINDPNFILTEYEIRRMQYTFAVSFPKLFNVYAASGDNRRAYKLNVRSTVGFANWDGKDINMDVKSKIKKMDWLVHELTHALQNYNSGAIPGWWVEGMADVGKFYYTPDDEQGFPFPSGLTEHYTKGYEHAARWFMWIEHNYRPNFVVNLNRYSQSGPATLEQWLRKFEEYAGGSPEVMWLIYIADPSFRDNTTPRRTPNEVTPTVTSKSTSENTIIIDDGNIGQA